MAEKKFIPVKVTDREWAEKLLDGEVFMRPLYEFGAWNLKKEDKQLNNSFRGDLCEGMSGIFGEVEECPIYDSFDENVKKYIKQIWYIDDLESPRIQFENHYVHRLAVFDDELYSLFVEKFKGNDNYKRLYLVDSLKVYLTELLRKPGTADISKTMCNLKKLSAWIRDRNLNERDGVRKYTYKVSEKKLTELIEVMMTTYEINITEKGV